LFKRRVWLSIISIILHLKHMPSHEFQNGFVHRLSPAEANEVVDRLPDLSRPDAARFLRMGTIVLPDTRGKVLELMESATFFEKKSNAVTQLPHADNAFVLLTVSQPGAIRVSPTYTVLPRELAQAYRSEFELLLQDPSFQKEKQVVNRIIEYRGRFDELRGIDLSMELLFEFFSRNWIYILSSNNCLPHKDINTFRSDVFELLKGSGASAEGVFKKDFRGRIGVNMYLQSCFLLYLIQHYSEIFYLHFWGKDDSLLISPSLLHGRWGISKAGCPLVTKFIDCPLDEGKLL